MKLIYFLLICISVSSCSLEPDFAIRSEFKKTEQESNQFESKQVLTINVADGVLESQLRDDAVNLLTEFLNHYDDYYGLMDLFSAESKQYINNPFYSYHVPE